MLEEIIATFDNKFKKIYFYRIIAKEKSKRFFLLKREGTEVKFILDIKSGLWARVDNESEIDKLLYKVKSLNWKPNPLLFWTSSKLIRDNGLDFATADLSLYKKLRVLNSICIDNLNAYQHIMFNEKNLLKKLLLFINYNLKKIQPLKIRRKIRELDLIWIG